MKFKTKKNLSISGMLVATIFFLGIQFSNLVSAAEDVTLSPDSGEYNFGEVKIGDKFKELDIWITNNSERDLILTKALESGSDTQFNIGIQGAEDYISPKSKGLVVVNFLPLSPTGEKKRVLNIRIKDKESGALELERKINLSGTIAVADDGGTTETACKGKKEGQQCAMGGEIGFGNCKMDGGELACVIDNPGGDGGEKNSGDPFAVYLSSCTGGIVNEKQTGCSHAGDDEIINNQCKAEQYKSELSKCANMSAYLSAMTADCNALKPSGVVCDVIDNGGFYGREASAFADYYINTYLENKGGKTGSECEGMKEGEQCDMGGGLGFGKCKMDNMNGASKEELVCVIDNPDGGGKTGGGGVYIPGAEIGLSEKSIQEILVNLLTWALEIVGVLALLGFVVSGIQYIVSSGDEGIMESAKRNMLYSIMGVIVVLASVVIIKAIEAALRAKSLI